MSERDEVRAAIVEELLDFAALWPELPTSDLQAAADPLAEKIIKLARGES
jgi:hypothetical protein